MTREIEGSVPYPEPPNSSKYCMNGLQIATYCLYALITILEINSRDTMTLPLIIQGQLWSL
jgi:hypothetical protein